MRSPTGVCTLHLLCESLARDRHHFRLTLLLALPQSGLHATRRPGKRMPGGGCAMPCPCYAMAKNWLLCPEGLVSSGMQGGFSDPLHRSQMLLNLPALFLNLPPLFLLYLSILHFLLLSLPPSGSPRSQGTWPGSPSSSN